MSSSPQPKRRSTLLPYQSNVSIKDEQRRSIANTMHQEALCDVTFLIGPQQIEFRANRIFLAAISEVFKAMLYGSMQESKPNSTVVIPDIDAEAFKSVLDFAYCNDPQITVQNVTSIANIAQKYQISTLSPLCNNHFNSYLDKNSICTLLNDTVNLHLTDLISSCTNAIKQRLGYFAKDIIKTDGFLQMGLPAMSLFLKIETLRIKEEALWQALLEWNERITELPIEHDGEHSNANEPPRKRRKLDAETMKNNAGLKAICPYIRFGLMAGEYFVEEVQPTNYLSNTLCFPKIPTQNHQRCQFRNVFGFSDSRSQIPRF